jgi:hypothetical protein
MAFTQIVEHCAAPSEHRVDIEFSSHMLHSSHDVPDVLLEREAALVFAFRQ